MISNPKKWLRLFFLITGISLSLAIVPSFFPISLMASIHEKLGLGTMPEGPIVEYLARSTSIFYAVHGVIMLTLFFKLDALWELVPIILVIHLFLGAFLIFTDVSAKMPLYWTAMEGAPVMAASFLMLVLYRQADRLQSTVDP